MYKEFEYSYIGLGVSNINPKLVEKRVIPSVNPSITLVLAEDTLLQSTVVC